MMNYNEKVSSVSLFLLILITVIIVTIGIFLIILINSVNKLIKDFDQLAVNMAARIKPV